MKKIGSLLLIGLMALASCVLEPNINSDGGVAPTPEIHFTLVVDDEQYHCRGWSVVSHDDIVLTIRMTGCLNYPNHQLLITNVSTLTVGEFQQ